MLEKETDAAEKAHNMNNAEAHAAFDRVMLKLKSRLGTEVFSSWFGRLKLVEASKSVARLSVPTPFLRAWINNHYLASDRRALA